MELNSSPHKNSAKIYSSTNLMKKLFKFDICLHAVKCHVKKHFNHIGTNKCMFYNKESFNSHFQMETRGLLLKWTIWQHIGHAIAISSRTIFLTMLFVGQHKLIQSWHFLQKKHYVTQKTTSYRRRKNIVIFLLQIQSFHLLCNISISLYVWEYVMLLRATILAST